jgi:FAD:protein FMN transferase
MKKKIIPIKLSVNACLIPLLFLLMTGCGGGTTDSVSELSKQSGVSKTSEISGTSETEEQDPVSREVYAMDTYMTLTVYGDSEVAQEAADQAEQEIYRLDALLSAQNSTSQVAQLNENGGGTVTGDIALLLDRALGLWESTEGAFDIAIYPLERAWGFDGTEHRVPTEEEIQNLLPLVDAGKLSYEIIDEGEAQAADPEDSAGGTASAEDRASAEEENARKTGVDSESEDSEDIARNVEFGLEGMEIDFGGIAKGYTSACLMDIFRKCGVTSAMVNLGGNVQTLGTKPDGSPWRVAVKDPDDPEKYLGIVNVSDKAVVTSGGYERYFEENGKIYHHILDPATGYPADSGLLSVTIVAEDGTLADGLSTACFVMGLDQAESYWRSRRERGEEFDMILMTEDRKVYVTAGIAENFTSENETIVCEE